ncbi:hypothetical protein [Carboxylicivirga taeanensis]|uniref:hypothetical protein n=1 Tax=Carboxylicivirga taeanensis TaxID=1416875 RepID=UPI003F6E30BE
MNSNDEPLNETYDSYKIIENALLVCHILPLVIIGILSYGITQLMPIIPIPLALVLSICISWVVYCVSAVKFVIMAMIYSEERSSIYKVAISNRLLMKESLLSKIFIIGNHDKQELNELLSNPNYKRGPIKIEIKTSLSYLLGLLASSIAIDVFILTTNNKIKDWDIRYWLMAIFAFIILLNSMKGLINRKTIIALLPQGIQISKGEIIPFEKIKDFKIIKRKLGRSYTKYITFQHLTKYLERDAYVYNEIEIKNCNISTQKLNFYYRQNIINYNR